MARAIVPKLGTYVLVDIGSYSTGVGIVKDSMMVFSRSIPTAGNALTRAVSQYLGIDIIQAEEYKKAYGLDKTKLEGKVRDAMIPIIGVLGDEIKKALHFYKTEEQGESPKAVYLSGGSSTLPALISELGQILGVEVAAGNAFSEITVSPQEQKDISFYAPFYAVATGLAKRD